MSQYIYARLAGHGWILLPHAPFEFQRVPGRPRAVDVSHDSTAGVRNVRVDCSADPPAVDLGVATGALDEVLDLLPGPEIDGWFIQTSLFVCPWPEPFSLVSAESAQPAVFYLTGPEKSLVFVQGPFPMRRVPAPADMVAPGQTLLRQGQAPCGRWIEVGYTYEGQAWRQWHRVVKRGETALVVTAQAPLAQAGTVEVAARDLADGLIPYEE